MGLFTRVRDIINSNVHALLDKAEDPEKLVRLLIREMEQALGELKSVCATAMADEKRVQRRLREARSRVELWSGRARLAMERGNEELARAALKEQRDMRRRVESLEEEQAQLEAEIGQYKTDIGLIEEKLDVALEQRRALLHRKEKAREREESVRQSRRYDTTETFARFDEIERRVEHGADRPWPGSRGAELEAAFAQLAEDEEIDRELEALRQSLAPASTP